MEHLGALDLRVTVDVHLISRCPSMRGGVHLSFIYRSQRAVSRVFVGLLLLQGGLEEATHGPEW